MNLYRLIRPLPFRLDPENAHNLAIRMLALASRSKMACNLLALAMNMPQGQSKTVFGIKFPNIIGLAAGMDKNFEALLAWASLGFGFVEGGTVTRYAQPGNPRPRIFRYPKLEALINRMGFNNDGADAVMERLDKLGPTPLWPRIPVGINIGKSVVTPLENAVEDYLYSFERLRPLGDYFVLNVSSPNTKGLRTLQDRNKLEVLFEAIQSANPGRKPVLVKIAPDLTDLQVGEVIEMVEKHRLAGIIATNTTLDHSDIQSDQDEKGGLSGKPVRRRSTEIIRFITEHSKVPVIGVGGISDLNSAIEKIDAGADLIQLYTGFVYKGPWLIRELCSHL